MDMFEIKGSSKIEKYGWEATPGGFGPRRTGLLTLEFKDGTQYHYSSVPERVLEDFLMSESRGQFFERHIKGHYTFVKAEKEIS